MISLKGRPNQLPDFLWYTRPINLEKFSKGLLIFSSQNDVTSFYVYLYVLTSIVGFMSSMGRGPFIFLID
ncbi:hypothetical protein ERO13_D07G076250v2 [Gossypium hirsutum]|uniref:Uncharacterized protein n=3 Tax=Gossypium TaxID=3633 RepID=A0A0D2QMA1_GOSRA|nr:hypothetical protein ES319_D07G080300v1 [Gossypium barbadense]KAG4137524.1 hypothetical protein ERO13_D07G076250v2 [Gossypium hirsutum]KJB08415.1 hypothetical protein B456_001G080900 [Gossypium raimondii]TYI72776.1 hypothetical protein E1A91_D07G082800v1 [Gossypium mustelinum]